MEKKITPGSQHLWLLPVIVIVITVVVAEVIRAGAVFVMVVVVAVEVVVVQWECLEGTSVAVACRRRRSYCRRC